MDFQTGGTDGVVVVSGEGATAAQRPLLTVGYNTAPPDVPVATAAAGVSTTAFTANWNAAVRASSYRLDVATDGAFSSLVAGYNDLTVAWNQSERKRLESNDLHTTIVYVLTMPQAPVVTRTLSTLQP